MYSSPGAHEAATPLNEHSLRGPVKRAVSKLCLGSVGIGATLITPAATAEYTLADTFPGLACVGADKTALQSSRAALSAGYLVDVFNPAIPHSVTKARSGSPEKATYQEAQKWRKFDLARQHGVTVFDLDKTIAKVNMRLNGTGTPDVAAAYKLAKKAVRQYGIKLYVPQLDDAKTPMDSSDTVGIGLQLLGTLTALNDMPKELITFAGVKQLRIEHIDSNDPGGVVAGRSMLGKGIIRLNPATPDLDLDKATEVFGHEVGHHVYLALCGGMIAMNNDEALQTYNPAGFHYTGENVPTSAIPPTVSELGDDPAADARVAHDLKYARPSKPSVSIDLEKNLANIAFLAPYNTKSTQEDAASILQSLITQQTRPLVGLLGSSPLGQKTYLMEARLRRALPDVAGFLNEYFGSVIINS